MKKLNVLMLITLFGLTIGSCSSDDNTNIDGPTTDPVNPTEQIAEEKYKEAAIGVWNWTKQVYLDKDEKVIKTDDFASTTACGLDTWNIEEEYLQIKFNYKNEYGECDANTVKAKYNIDAKNFFMLWPTEDTFVPRGYFIQSFTNKSITLREHGAYTAEDVEYFNYPEGTVYVELILEQ
ncbi:hypothetical protein [Myroides pelagicus]|uniref:Lipocalin-like domain-containing protein n=1 Tax=Myroides pelagicus TaxID=270914 RepID=A0A7K1GHN3_9FLAO|nr:hypothetical protein [Myroides pelagicus]MTH28477.1 hypothetical protein [Myroides pelagicus]